jgi:shikimate dehydrogenase
LAAPALAINATGLGKDRPGSPLTLAAPLGPATLAWDLNYRGDLTFLRQAAACGAKTVNGWECFVAGWAGALTAIAGLPLSDRILPRFTEIAAPHQPQADNGLAGGTP